MPVVFEQIDTEIAPEPRSEPPAQDAQPALPSPAVLAELVRRELMRIEARRLRLQAD
jgi:hypothetical protein